MDFFCLRPFFRPKNQLSAWTLHKFGWLFYAFIMVKFSIPNFRCARRRSTRKWARPEITGIICIFSYSNTYLPWINCELYRSRNREIPGRRSRWQQLKKIAYSSHSCRSPFIHTCFWFPVNIIQLPDRLNCKLFDLQLPVAEFTYFCNCVYRSISECAEYFDWDAFTKHIKWMTIAFTVNALLKFKAK